MDNYTTCKRTWYCSLCDKDMNVNRKTGHINSIFFKRRERFDFIVEKFEFDKPETTRTDVTVRDVIEDCKDNYSHTFEYTCEYDLKLKHKTSGEVF